MKKKVIFKYYGMNGKLHIFTEKHSFAGKINVTEAYRRRQNDISCKLAMKEIADEENKRFKKDQELLIRLEDELDQKLVEDIKYYLEDCENTLEYSIEDEVNSICEKQVEEEYIFKHCYIYQTAGICGDDYSGMIFIPLPNSKYFKFEYYM